MCIRDSLAEFVMQRLNLTPKTAPDLSEWAALNSMSQSLAKYLAPYGISVGVIAPGFVPVSYTHLDVYKRQSQPLPFSRSPEWIHSISTCRLQAMPAWCSASRTLM